MGDQVTSLLSLDYKIKLQRDMVRSNMDPQKFSILQTYPFLSSDPLVISFLFQCFRQTSWKLYHVFFEQSVLN